jgi:hypothetical protein
MKKVGVYKQKNVYDHQIDIIIEYIRRIYLYTLLLLKRKNGVYGVYQKCQFAVRKSEIRIPHTQSGVAAF